MFPLQGEIIYSASFSELVIAEFYFSYLNTQQLDSQVPAIMALTTFQAQMLKKGPFTVPVPGAPSVPGETIPRRNAHHPNELLTQPSPDIRTVWDLVQQGAKKFGDDKSLGTRKVIKKHVETKKVKTMVDGELKDVDTVWIYWEMGPYEWLGFREYEGLVRQIGCGFRSLGLEKGDRVHIFAATRWVCGFWR